MEDRQVGPCVRSLRHNGDFVDGASTWTIHPVDANHSTVTIDAAQTMGPVRGPVMSPFLKRIFCGINFTPFIQEAEQRAKETRAFSALAQVPAVGSASLGRGFRRALGQSHGAVTSGR